MATKIQPELFVRNFVTEMVALIFRMLWCIFLGHLVLELFSTLIFCFATGVVSGPARAHAVRSGQQLLLDVL